jgi:hypothetical protein
MAVEYRIQLSDPNWYSGNRERIASRIRALPRLKAEVPELEFRLKDDETANTWSYDLRVFLRDTDIQVEVSSPTRTFFEDVRAVLNWIREETSAELVDDDGVAVNL